jgi:DNA topoisomerase VI subunit B
MRKAFSTPRLAEFATRQGLTTRVGMHPDWWPLVALKELVDNPIDDAETQGLAPAVVVTIEDDAIIVADQGRGVDPEVVARIFDYDRQTSSREAYVEPTRGAQGNALQTILAMPYVLSGLRGELVIESRGVRHDLSFTVDPVTNKPMIDHARSVSDVNKGTRVTIEWPHSLAGRHHSLEVLVDSFASLNPHLAITRNGTTIPAFDPKWRKWRPNRPPVARWYTIASLKRLMQAFAADAEQNGGPSPTVGAFVRGFDGLTGTQKAAAIVNPLGLARLTLADLLRSPNCDAHVGALLAAMHAETREVRPEELGKLGRASVERVARSLGVSKDAPIVYDKKPFVSDGLPFFVEVAFAYFGADRDDDGEPIRRILIAGLNFSPALGADPFRNLGDSGGESLRALFADRRAGEDDPVFVLVHVTTPRFVFTTKGKDAVTLPPNVAKGLTEMVVKATAR